ncbi:hypothetical protein [Streptomyces sp. NBC_00467]|uniref:hypothetical protein n=1 Tax=Streptomyces sp. NBC_00467 TaxID=2975752 RepID=UPI002E18546A
MTVSLELTRAPARTTGGVEAPAKRMTGELPWIEAAGKVTPSCWTGPLRRRMLPR